MYITRIFLAIVFGVNILLGGAYGIAQANALSAPTAPNDTIRYVDADAPGPGNGFSWATAFPSLQNALLVSNSGDQIWVAEGVYYPDRGIGHTDDDPTNTFALKDNVKLYGGFDPQSGVDEFSERDWETYVTVLSGDIDQNDTVDSHGVVITTTHITGNNAYHVVTGNGVSKSAVMDGFVITAGQANGDHPNGGGMYNNNSSDPTLTNVTFSGNSAHQHGGGMYNNNSSDPTLTNVTFLGNSALSHGGGMKNDFSNPTLTDVTFADNSASYGGGLNNYDSGPILSNVVFSGNSAQYYGGGMFNENNEFNGDPMLTNVVFSGNSASINGGGMYNGYLSDSTLTNVVFSGNSASYGGGMCNMAVSPTLTNVTFVGNSASIDGGGMFNDGNPVLTNTIFWLNLALETGNQIRNENGGIPLINYSDIQGCGGSGVDWQDALGTDGGGNIQSDPLFVRNPDPGPDGQWDGVEDDYGDLHLRYGSLTIDSGTNSGCPATDLDGTPRPVNDICDMGAYEYLNLPPLAVDDDGPGFTTDEDTPFTTTSVLANDSDPNADTLILQSIDTSSTKGQVWDNGEGPFNYDPNGQFDYLAVGETATDSFNYTINDGHGGTDTATVTISITGLNDPPTASNDIGFGFFTKKDTPFTTANVLTNDSDPDGDTLILQSINTSGTKGLVSDNGDGTFNYDPNGQFEDLAHEIELDSFYYTINDGHGGTDTAKVTIAVVGLNDAPIANDDSGTGFSTDEDTSFTTTSVLVNDSDPDGDTLSLQSFDNSGTKGLVSDNGDGTFNYDPNGQFEDLALSESATDSFTYTISDGYGGTDTATVTISIIGLQDESLIYLPLLEH